MKPPQDPTAHSPGPSAGSDDAAVLQRHLVVEANAALAKGALFALLPAITGASVLPVLMWAGLAQGLRVPWLFCLLCLAACGTLYLLARRQRVRAAQGLHGVADAVAAQGVRAASSGIATQPEGLS